MVSGLVVFSSFMKICNVSYVALPLSIGDAVFCNPAVFLAAGENHSQNMDGKVNVLQVSSAFAKTTKSMNSNSLVNAVGMN